LIKNNNSIPTVVWDQDTVVMNLYDEINNLKRKLDQQMEMYNSLEKNFINTMEKNDELEKKVKELSDSTDIVTSKKSQSRYWTKEEHEKFLEALSLYGKKDVKKISLHVGSSNPTQVRTHAQKYFLKQKKDTEKKSQQKEIELMQKEEQLQREWSKIQTTRKSSSSPSIQTIPREPMYQPQNMDNRRSYQIPPQKDPRPMVQPFYYSNTPYDYFPELKREQGYNIPPYQYDNVYPPKKYNYHHYQQNQGEFIYNTQVDSNSLQSMAASINHPIDGKTNYKMINPITPEDDDEELNRIISEKKIKKTHILSEVIGQPVTISPQIYASPSPLLNCYSPTYFNPFAGGSPKG